MIKFITFVIKIEYSLIQIVQDFEIVQDTIIFVVCSQISKVRLILLRKLYLKFINTEWKVFIPLFINLFNFYYLYKFICIQSPSVIEPLPRIILQNLSCKRWFFYSSISQMIQVFLLRILTDLRGRSEYLNNKHNCDLTRKSIKTSFKEYLDHFTHERAGGSLKITSHSVLYIGLLFGNNFCPFIATPRFRINCNTRNKWKSFSNSLKRRLKLVLSEL